MPAPAPPEMVDAGLMLRAQGYSLAEVGRRVGASPQGVHGWLQRMGDRFQRLKALADARWARNVLRSADAVSRALIRDAVSEERDDKGRPMIRGADRAQCARALWEPLKGPESLTIVGDVDASTNISADVRALVVQGASADELRKRAEELRAKLGF